MNDSEFRKRYVAAAVIAATVALIGVGWYVRALSEAELRKDAPGRVPMIILREEP